MKFLQLVSAVGFCASLAYGETCNPDWNQIGPGGGGRVSSPAISPHDPNLLLAGSDMDGVYRSTNSGRAWTFLPASEIQGVIPNYYNFSGGNNYYETRFAFHPTSANLVLAGTKRGMKVSRDAGLTWKDVNGSWNSTVEDKFLGPTLIEFSQKTPQFVVAAFNHFKGADKTALFYSVNSGTTWEQFSGFSASALQKVDCERIVGLGLDIDTGPPAQALRTFVVACTSGLYRTENYGATFAPIGSTLPGGGKKIKDMAWSRAPSAKSATLYVLPACNEDSVFAQCKSPLYISYDLGDRWTPTSDSGLFEERKVRDRDWHAEYLQIGVSRSRPDTLYLTMKGTHRAEKDALAQLNAYGYGSLYVSTDSGRSWKNTFHRHPQQREFNFNESWRTTGKWGWHLPPEGISVYEKDPNIAFVAEALTYSAGEKWYVTDTLPFAIDQGEAVRGGGMPIMGAWRYFYAPETLRQWGPNLQFAAMTDFPSWRTEDSGKSWYYSYPQMTNVYSYGFDSASGKIIAGGGFVHDLLNWRWLDEHRLKLTPSEDASQKNAPPIQLGVVSQSSDGKNWTVLAKTPGVVTSIEVIGANDYLLGVMGVGVMRLKNGNLTNHSRGIEGNLNVYRVGRIGSHYFAMTVIRPGGYTYSAGRIFFKSALYPLDDPFDDARNPWVPDPFATAPGAELAFPVGVEFDSDEVGTYYVAALSSPKSSLMTRRTTGGLWKRTLDNRKKVVWSRLVAGNFSDVKILRNATKAGGRIFIVTDMGVGVKYSTDEGKTWRLYSSLPISNPISISEDPRTAQSGSIRAITITTFGQGIWRGWLDCSESN